MRTLVTGASGFLGSALVRRLLRDGHEVYGLTRSGATSAGAAGYPARLHEVRDGIRLHEGSLTDRAAMDALVRASRPDVVFHLGALTHVGTSWNRVDECVAVNEQGTLNLLQALDAAGWPAARFVFTSTSEVYGDVDVPFVETGPVNPISPYSVSKYAAERYCRMFVRARGWPIVIVRPFNAYGPRQSPDRVIPEVIVRGLRRERLAMTWGRQTREFCFVEDLADGILRAGTTPGIDGTLMNLGTGTDISMRDLACRVLRLMGDPIAPEFGALPDRPAEIPRMYCDASRARELLGWQPRTALDDGLAATIDWYRAELSPTASAVAL